MSKLEEEGLGRKQGVPRNKLIPGIRRRPSLSLPFCFLLSYLPSFLLPSSSLLLRIHTLVCVFFWGGAFVIISNRSHRSFACQYYFRPVFFCPESSGQKMPPLVCCWVPLVPVCLLTPPSPCRTTPAKRKTRCNLAKLPGEGVQQIRESTNLLGNPTKRFWVVILLKLRVKDTAMGAERRPFFSSIP